MGDAAGDDVSDHVIAEQMFDGKEQGICSLLRRYGARVEYVLKQQFCPVLNHDDVKDVVNFAGAKAFKSAHTFDSAKGTLGNWFYAIAHNTAIDFIRGAGKSDRPTVPLDYDPAIEGRVPAELEPELSPAQAKAVIDIEDAISLLPNMQQTIIRADLAAGERADDAWLATQLNTTVNSIRVQRCNAHRTIKDILTKKGARSVVQTGARK